MDIHQKGSDQFIAALERLSSALRSLQWNAAYAEGLYPLQLQVLMLCSSRRGQALTPSSIAAELNVTAPTMSDTLAALERKGLIERKSNPDDRRGVIVQLTADAERLLQRMRAWDEPLHVALARIPISHRELAYQTLLELLRELYYSGVITVPRMCLTCRWLRYSEQQVTTPYYCELLAMELVPLDLRLDCPDHEQVIH